MTEIAKIGFTGTRKGMTYAQLQEVRGFLVTLKDDLRLKAVHGDCVGADEEFHKICRDIDIWVQQRPCTRTEFRAYTDAPELEGPQEPLLRNRRIVRGCDVLLACPHTMTEQGHGGTWYTIREGRRKNKQVVIVYPDGTIVEDCPGSLDQVIDA